MERFFFGNTSLISFAVETQSKFRFEIAESINKMIEKQAITRKSYKPRRKYKSNEMEFNNPLTTTIEYNKKHNYRFNLYCFKREIKAQRLIVNRQLRENKKLNWTQLYGEIYDDNNPEQVEENNQRASNNSQPNTKRFRYD